MRQTFAGHKPAVVVPAFAQPAGGVRLSVKSGKTSTPDPVEGWLRWYFSSFLMPFLRVFQIPAMQTQPDSFQVDVSFEDGGYIAECEAIGLVTEADTYEELLERAWEIAPEIAELNGITGAFSLVFCQTQRQPV
ncbi:MAG: DUF1902 domain-containing protein [Zoogloeaceae bacterium]|nr:DUF1902 domain-containing protein [Zoogloeaceae bacterium]